MNEEQRSETKEATNNNADDPGRLDHQAGGLQLEVRKLERRGRSDEAAEELFDLVRTTDRDRIGHRIAQTGRAQRGEACDEDD